MKPVLSKLKLKRLELRKTQQEVAKAIGISREYVNSLENNRSTISNELLVKFAKYYGCSASELI